jgi:hypothetical protein
MAAQTTMDTTIAMEFKRNIPSINAPRARIKISDRISGTRILAYPSSSTQAFSPNSSSEAYTHSEYLAPTNAIMKTQTAGIIGPPTAKINQYFEKSALKNDPRKTQIKE